MLYQFRDMFIRAALATVIAGCYPPAAGAENPLLDALTKGKVDLFARLRYENVDDAQKTLIIPSLQDANAVTLRTALGYNTALFHGFGLYLQFEDVRAIDGNYNDGGTNGKVQYATVVDPEGTEVQQANIRYEGLSNITFRLGRQEIEHRPAPLHRFVGNILWRQNWQSFDAIRVMYSDLIDPATGLPDVILDYSYVWNTNRIFGEDNPIRDRSDFPMDSHFLNARYLGFNLLKIEAYAYLLNFRHPQSERFDTMTFGVRGEGDYKVGKNLKALYTAEFANQRDAYDNPADDLSVNYYLGELGAAYTFGKKYLDTAIVKLSYEVLEGDGMSGNTVPRSFQTPLGTNHAFQGWADRFLITPADGIRDLFITAKAGVYGATVLLMYHDFSSDSLGYDYGTELDLLLEKPIARHWTAGVKYSAYDADQDPLNPARNSASGQAFDLNKVWAYIQFKY